MARHTFTVHPDPFTIEVDVPDGYNAEMVADGLTENDIDDMIPAPPRRWEYAVSIGDQTAGRHQVRVWRSDAISEHNGHLSCHADGCVIR